MRSLIVLLGLVLVACGTAPASTGGNAADIRFAQEMVPHHEQSVRLARLAEQRAESEFVRTTAHEIAEEETAEIARMNGWLRAWHAETSGHAGHPMPGMLPDTTITALEDTYGAEFDRGWLTTMAQHLGAGVEMARAVLSRGEHAETRALAGEIVREQQAQIAEINDQLSR
ncbi:DUF305 domain-containing protein [Amycolatopsis endophytica]|uniref:Uncharacterized protein (DUF305 family) n=1 Tax=Amycolatopsis endophytica TaxID=860233 RepID=A0A853B908_9PSEU|nr:DUF305 domain-containing protein [Amycolatopsis endophytica]NYI91254.1 uncharacterized protein (DUF305 family) [Amycolatopsis endophytica]